MDEFRPCAEHGGWCFIQADGRHINARQCTCKDVYQPDCPVEYHREHPGKVPFWSRAALFTRWHATHDGSKKIP